MTTSNLFFESVTTLIDNISSIFIFDKELSDSGSDSYHFINSNGKTELTFDYTKESVSVTHISTNEDRYISIRYVSPTGRRVQEISACIAGLAS